jgi:hypothetical protein
VAGRFGSPFGAPQLQQGSTSAGKFVTTVEQQHSNGQRTGTLEYMSITCNPAFKHQSFEEVRLQVTTGDMSSFVSWCARTVI